MPTLTDPVKTTRTYLNSRCMALVNFYWVAQVKGAGQLGSADPLLECGVSDAQHHSESFRGTAMTCYPMKNALREWRDLPDGVPGHTTVCGPIEHTMCGLEPTSVTINFERARLLRL